MSKWEIQRLLTDLGHAINANNGQCQLIESVLCRCTTLCVRLLGKQEDEAREEYEAEARGVEFVSGPDPQKGR